MTTKPPEGNATPTPAPREEVEYTFKVHIRTDQDGTHAGRAMLLASLMKSLASRPIVTVSRRQLSKDEIEQLDQTDIERDMEKLKNLGQKQP